MAAAHVYPGRRLILVLASVGAGLSLVLEVVHYRAYAAPGSESFCSLGERLDCSSVALSKYAVLLGVPLPLWGLAGFVAMGLAAWQSSRWLLPLAGLAALAGVVLTGLSAWSIGAFCVSCELVHVLSASLLVLAWRARRELGCPSADHEVSALVFLPPLGLLLAIAFFIPRYWGMFAWTGELPFAHGKTEDGHAWIGAAEPKLTLEEFVDYSCPHCKAATARNLMRLAAHPDELRLVRRFYPRTMCQPRSEARCLAPRIAFCAGEQDRFWQADRWLFVHAEGGRDPSLDDAARDLDLDRARLGECVTRDATFELAVEEWKRARKLRIPGTPYYSDGSKSLTPAQATALIEAL
jgi:uncharacterized membrane protein